MYKNLLLSLSAIFTLGCGSIESFQNCQNDGGSWTYDTGCTAPGTNGDADPTTAPDSRPPTQFVPDHETVAIPPSLIAHTTSSLTVTASPSDADGIRNLAFRIYTNVAATNQIQVNSTGHFGGLNENTTYYFRYSVEALNATENAWEVKYSNVAAFKTAQTYTPPTDTGGGTTAGGTGNSGGCPSAHAGATATWTSCSNSRLVNVSGGFLGGINAGSVAITFNMTGLGDTSCNSACYTVWIETLSGAGHNINILGYIFGGKYYHKTQRLNWNFTEGATSSGPLRLNPSKTYRFELSWRGTSASISIYDGGRRVASMRRSMPESPNYIRVMKIGNDAHGDKNQAGRNVRTNVRVSQVP